MTGQYLSCKVQWKAQVYLLHKTVYMSYHINKLYAYGGCCNLRSSFSLVKCKIFVWRNVRESFSISNAMYQVTTS